MAVVALVVFVSLFFVDAGYGKFYDKKWGPAVNNKTSRSEERFSRNRLCFLPCWRFGSAPTAATTWCAWRSYSCLSCIISNALSCSHSGCAARA